MNHPPLTPMEAAILDRLIVGQSVLEIAVECGRSPHTVHDHVKSLHWKLGCTSRGKLVAKVMGLDTHPLRPWPVTRPGRPRKVAP